MDFEKSWSKALKHTEIIRNRIQSLSTFDETHVSYITLSESSVNEGDTLVRQGQVVVEKPSLILPPNIPQFEGFEMDEDSSESQFIHFLLVRGVTIPSFKYNNVTHSIDIYEGSVSKAVNVYNKNLQQQENVHTGLIVCPEDTWQFSVLIFICSQISKNADLDIRRLLERHKDGRNIH